MTPGMRAPSGQDYELARLRTEANRLRLMRARRTGETVADVERRTTAPRWTPWQLADDEAAYGAEAGWWVLTTPDGETEHPGMERWATEAEAEAAAQRIAAGGAA